MDNHNPPALQIMDSTSLTLMTGDGMLRLIFRPSLTVAQYEQLLFAVQREDIRTRQQFRDTLAIMAKEWRVEFIAENVMKPSND